MVNSMANSMAKVAVAQMLSGEDLAANLRQAENLIVDAAKAGVKLLVLPENFALLDSAALISLAKQEAVQPSIEPLLTSLAQQHNIWIIAGSLPVLSPVPERVYARCVVFSPEQGKVASYDKIHLFDVDVADSHGAYRESDFMAPGECLTVAETPFGNIGLSICYDLRFPEQYQKLRELGADIIVVPAAFTYTTGKAHWEVLLRARAIETQCYILAPNQGGKHTPNRASWGHSMVVDPWGDIIAVKEEDGPGLVFAELDLAALQKRRKNMPIMQHKQKAGF